MNLDELRSAQAKERRKDSLQHLRDSFYDDVGAYVADLRAARDRRAEQVENPFADDDVRRLSDEVETAEEVAEALYERRVGKVVKLASFAAADMSVDEEGMTTEERRLFDDLVERITANKSEVLDVLAGESPVPDDAPTADGTSAAPDAAGAGGPAPSDPTRSDPESSDQVPSDPAAENEKAPTGTEPGDASPADALAGAMGGTEADSTAGSPPDPTEDDAAPPAPEATEGTAGDGTEIDGDDDPTPVPPEPAPPGAVGVDEDPDGVADGTPAGDGDEEPTADATTDGGAVPGGAAGGEPATDSSTAADADPAEGTERATVRITRDVGAIFGVDEREYELASEDVVSLPVENADPLVQRDAAERID
jgi:DNA replication factor GINS